MLRSVIFSLGTSCLTMLALGSAAAEPARRTETGSKPLSQLTDAEFAFVEVTATRRFWVAQLTWSRQSGPAPSAKPQLIEPGTAFATVSKQQLPEPLKKLATEPVRIYGHDPTQSCTVKLRTWGVLADFEPSDDDDTKAMTAAFHSEGSGRARYAAELKLGPDCPKNALWARQASLPAVPTYPVTQLEGKALLAERARIRKTADFAEAQQRFRLEQPKGQWDQSADTNVSAFTCTVNDERFMIAHLQQFNDCESFSAEIVTTFRGRGSDARELSDDLTVDVDPDLALDLNGDAIPEWLSSWTLIGWDGGRYTIIVDNTPDVFGCPC